MYDPNVKVQYDKLKAILTARKQGTSAIGDMDDALHALSIIEDMHFQDAGSMKIAQGEITKEDAHLAYAEKHGTTKYMSHEIKMALIKRFEDAKLPLPECFRH